MGQCGSKKRAEEAQVEQDQLCEEVEPSCHLIEKVLRAP